MISYCPEKTNNSAFSSGFGGSGHKQGTCIAFSVRAESADSVFLVGTFNNWSEAHPLEKVCSDMWQITLSDV